MWRSRSRQSGNNCYRPIALPRLGAALFSLVLGLVASPYAYAQTSAGPARPQITQPVNDANLVTLTGNTRPEARKPANDRGRVADDLPLPHMILQLRRPAAQEQALTALIEQLHDPASPNYHRWLDAAELGTQFGPAQSDVAAVTNWLERQGFTVNAVSPDRMSIDYSGTAGQVRTAFHTEIHNLSVDGIAHIANMSDPQIPAALAPVIVGIVSLNDFRPHSMAVHRSEASPGFTRGSGYFISPPDLQTIYNLNPLFAAGHTGQGQTIYLLEDSDIYTNGGTVNDWATFRTGFGIPVSSYPGASLTTIHPNNCTDPGTNGDDAEAIIDAEYASAAAPSAAIVMVVCNNFVGALQTLFSNHTTYPPSVVSISYGNCEAENGAAGNAAYNSVYQTGVTAGWSIFVSAGDEGAGVCDESATVTHGIGVSGLASSQYDVAVGGTDFGDTVAGQNSTYWNTTNTASNGSAKSYVPEIPWNTTCGSQLFASFDGFSTSYGSSGFCNSSFVVSSNPRYLENWAGSGGPSGCATGKASVAGVVSGTCAGWPKPSWQNGLFGNPNDQVRDLPDVSMFASFGPWKHAYVICYSDTSQDGGVACNGSANGWSAGWGGTSFGAPIWAGIEALINEYTGSVQGNPNPVLYKLATAEYGASGSTSCNSSKGNTVVSSCIFYDVTVGDMDVPCESNASTLYNCYDPSGANGVLSTSNASYGPAYVAGAGWDFATGIGTVNVYNLVTNWASAGAGNAGLTISVTGNGTVTSSPSRISCPSICSASFVGGGQVTLTAQPSGGWILSGWGGACSGSGNCVVTMNAAQSVSATFVQAFPLSVGVSGSGTVSSSPSGINCGSTCSASYASGTQVTLTPAPAGGFDFSGWSGACSGTGSCVVSMNAAESVTATFAQGGTTALTVSVSGDGTVTTSPSGISCPSVCSAEYATGTQVAVTANPAAGATFNGWGGACSGAGSCQVTMDAIASVTAEFSTPGGGSPSAQTWVSAALGNDSNPCTRQSPCLTFAAALAQTTAGGEIDVLDPGDFGPVTINKAVSIYNDAGDAAGTLTSSPSTSSIVISAGSGDVINLRGLIFDSANQSGASGVLFNSGGRLHIQSCVIRGFATAGVSFSPGSGSAATAAMIVQDTSTLDNAVGILIKPTSSIAANVVLTRVHADKNSGTGVQADGTGGNGAINATIADSTASFNIDNGMSAISGPGNVTLNVTRIAATSNGLAGIQSNQSNGGTATVTVGNSLLNSNTIAAQSVGGVLRSYQNNQLSNNGTNGSFTGPAGLQ